MRGTVGGHASRARTTWIRAAGAVALVALLATGCGGAEPDGNAGSPAGPSAAEAGTSEPSPASGPRSGKGRAGDGSSEASTATSPGAEMPPEESGSAAAGAAGSGEGVAATGLPGLTPARPTGPLVPSPMPRSASATGRLVTGFPELLRPPARSSVVSSSLAAAAPRLQVALVGATPQGPEAVLGTYRARLTRQGLRERAAPPSVAGSEAVAFARGPSSVTVTVRREGARTTYTVFGVLHVDG